MNLSTEKLFEIGSLVRNIDKYDNYLYYVIWLHSSNVPVLYTHIKGFNEFRIEGLFAIFHLIDRLKSIEGESIISKKRDIFIEDLYNEIISKDIELLNGNKDNRQPGMRIINKIRKLFPDIALRVELEN